MRAMGTAAEHSGRILRIQTRGRMKCFVPSSCAFKLSDQKQIIGRSSGGRSGEV